MEILNQIATLNGMIILGFLLLNLLIGVYFSRGVTNITEYAIGKRNFSTAALGYTIMATWISGDIFTIVTYNTYSQGLYFMILTIAGGLSFVTVSYFFIPRMQYFLGKLSIAEALGDIYGNAVKALSAFAGIIYSLGTIAAQFSVIMFVLNDIFNVAVPYTVISCIIIIWYSTIGGIKSVTLTDVVQCFTFCLVIPITTFFIWKSYNNGSNEVLNALESAPIFNLSNNTKLFSALWLFLLWLFPTMDPAVCQRIFMARNLKQSMKSFLIAAVILVISYALMNLIGILLFAGSDNGLQSNNIEAYILNNCLPVNFKGFFVIGIMAMSMSTADSYINTTSILANDIRNVLGIRLSTKNELLTVRIISLLVGIFCLIISLHLENFMKWLMTLTNFYISITTVPLILTIFGFRTSSMSVLMGMITGLGVICVIEFFAPVVYGGFIAMSANLLVLLGSHYFLSQPGGWEPIADDGTFLEIQRERKSKRANFLESLKLSNLLITEIKSESAYVIFGAFVIVSHLFSLYSLPKNLVIKNELLIDTLSYILLSLSTILISLPVWRGSLNVVLFRNSIFYILIIALLYESSILVLINNFGALQIVIFTFSMLLTAILLRWQLTILFILLGLLFSIFFYQHYTSSHIEFGTLTIEVTMYYLVLMVFLICLAFLKPKTDNLDKLEAKSHNLWQKVNDMDKEVRSANAIKTEFINNIQHEVRTPITGITSLGQALWDKYDILPEAKRREGVYHIAKNSERLISLMNNILDLSNLTNLKMELNIQKTDLSEIVGESIKRCKKLYLEEKDLRFDVDISNKIYAKCDEYHISHTIDNLIINAILYSKPETTVKITLKEEEGIIKFIIRDEGVGIPEAELSNIFNPFTTSSKTHTPAGGRGVGLALCYAAIKAHGGRIWAKSDGISWAEFTFEL